MVIEIRHRPHWTLTNYNHVLTQWVARVYQLLDEARRLDSLDILIHYDGPYVDVVQCLTSVRVVRDCADGSGVVRPAWESLPPARNAYLPKVAALLIARLPGLPTGGENISVVERQGCRRISEMQKLVNAFKAVGRAVRVVDFAKMTFREQVACARESHVLIGAHGAGLTNTLFMRPGTLLVGLAPFAFALPVFARLASAVGVRYRRVEAEPAFPAKPPAKYKELLQPSKRDEIIARVPNELELRVLVRNVPELKVDINAVVELVRTALT